MLNNLNISAEQACYEDRHRVLNESPAANSVFKRYSLDLCAKLIFLFVNSIGKSSVNPVVFVDEVNNRNMYENLYKTKEYVSLDNNVSMICMRKISNADHVKTGVIWTIIQLICSIAGCFYFVATSFFIRNRKRRDLRIQSFISKQFHCYIGRIDSSINVYLLMSDHHFFSTLVAFLSCKTTCVLQHGLIQDKRFYWPIYASYFFAWGKNSVANLPYSKKIVITGTYKFNDCLAKSSSTRLEIPKRVLVCLSTSSSKEDIFRRLEPIFRLQDDFCFTLLIKAHPGSLFSLKDVKTAVGEREVFVYKEESLYDLDYDFVITEQSTAILDFASLGVPWMLFDDKDYSYFDKYQESIVATHTYEELLKVFEDFYDQKFYAATKTIMAEELNCGKSSIAFLVNQIVLYGNLNQDFSELVSS